MVFNILTLFAYITLKCNLSLVSHFFKQGPKTLKPNISTFPISYNSTAEYRMINCRNKQVLPETVEKVGVHWYGKFLIVTLPTVICDIHFQGHLSKTNCLCFLIQMVQGQILLGDLYLFQLMI